MAGVAMVLSSRGGVIQETQHGYQKVLVGVGCDESSDTGTFTIAKTDAAGYATAATAPITDFICESVLTDPETHAGRVFYRATFLKLKGA